jgi:cell division protein FtsZ
MDLAIGEFEEVGRIVKQFASEDATVVVGTVIDPEITDELRVTVVATGLGRPVATMVRPTLQPAARISIAASAGVTAAGAGASQQEPPMRVVRRAPMSANDYAALDKPAIQRKVAVGDGLRPEPEAEDILDIPAFLRRQAD